MGFLAVAIYIYIYIYVCVCVNGQSQTCVGFCLHLVNKNMFTQLVLRGAHSATKPYTN